MKEEGKRDFKWKLGDEGAASLLNPQTMLCIYLAILPSAHAPTSQSRQILSVTNRRQHCAAGRLLHNVLGSFDSFWTNGDETKAWLASKGIFRLNFLAKMGYKVTSSSSGSSRWSKRATLRFMSLKWIGFIDKILWKDKYTSEGRLGLITNNCLWK